MIIKLPLFVDLPRKTKKDKRVYLNLNTYRNLHYILNNHAKIVFKTLIHDELNTLPVMDKIYITYTLYPKTKRLCDVSNICCIVDKFFCDALVEAGKLTEDNYNFLPSVSYILGNVDKNNPRVEAEIDLM